MTPNITTREFVQDNPVASMFITFFGVYSILHLLFGFHGWFLLVTLLSVILVWMWADDDYRRERAFERRNKLLVSTLVDDGQMERRKSILDELKHVEYADAMASLNATCASFDDAEVGDWVSLDCSINSVSSGDEIACFNVNIIGDCSRLLHANIYMHAGHLKGSWWEIGKTIDVVGKKTGTDEMVEYMTGFNTL
jgi:hypothetical protein